MVTQKKYDILISRVDKLENALEELARELEYSKYIDLNVLNKIQSLIYDE